MNVSCCSDVTKHQKPDVILLNNEESQLYLFFLQQRSRGQRSAHLWRSQKGSRVRRRPPHTTPMSPVPVETAPVAMENSLRQMHSCPELSDPAASHPIMPADEGQDLLTEMMDLFQSLDLLGGSLTDLQELDWSDPEPDLQNQDQDDGAVTRRGHPVRSLVEWVKSTV